LKVTFRGGLVLATWFTGQARPETTLGTQRPPQKVGEAPNFRPMSVVAKRLYASGFYFVWR